MPRRFAPDESPRRTERYDSPHGRGISLLWTYSGLVVNGPRPDSCLIQRLRYPFVHRHLFQQVGRKSRFIVRAFRKIVVAGGIHRPVRPYPNLCHTVSFQVIRPGGPPPANRRRHTPHPYFPNGQKRYHGGKPRTGTDGKNGGTHAATMRGAHAAEGLSASSAKRSRSPYKYNVRPCDGCAASTCRTDNRARSRTAG